MIMRVGSTTNSGNPSPAVPIFPLARKSAQLLWHKSNISTPLISGVAAPSWALTAPDSRKFVSVPVACVFSAMLLNKPPKALLSTIYKKPVAMTYASSATNKGASSMSESLWATIR